MHDTIYVHFLAFPIVIAVNGNGREWEYRFRGKWEWDGNGNDYTRMGITIVIPAYFYRT